MILQRIRGVGIATSPIALLCLALYAASMGSDELFLLLITLSIYVQSKFPE